MLSLAQAFAYAAVGALALIVLNIAHQLLPHDKTKPPVVFHWLPFLGSTISYGMQPYSFFLSCQEKVRGDTWHNRFIVLTLNLK